MNNTVKKSVQVLSQTALAVTLLMGNITPPAEQGYYEDDAGFNQVSASMESGWGWGFNKAQAAGSTGCWDTTEWEPMPCSGSQDSSSSQESSYADNDLVEGAAEAGMNFTVPSLNVPSFNIDAGKMTTLAYADVEAATQSSLQQGLTFRLNNLLAGNRSV
ncbi:hypothetical protein [Thalassomonas actiniarum]|uniref:Uncharacterized protein n=1 Tax=Thalassomonas actiniarum TaxID=485447 RepID=A0AAE9YQN8_9GAMM|nr:hypothetical protein [Thalassomonas actiniarum]WDD98508.1 hypothetical protein SG35_025180 [Thalassomonas actiniarum]